MTGNETVSNQDRSHRVSFAKVLDGRKQPIRGLWVRNGRYYARLNIENPITGTKNTKRVALVDKDGSAFATTAQAVAELKRLQTQRADNALPVLARQPKFAEYAARYLDFVSSGQGTKKANTIPQPMVRQQAIAKFNRRMAAGEFARPHKTPTRP